MGTVIIVPFFLFFANIEERRNDKNRPLRSRSAR